MSTVKNDASKAGQKAGAHLQSARTGISVGAIHTRFEDVSWFVYSGGVDEYGLPEVIGQYSSSNEAHAAYLLLVDAA